MKYFTSFVLFALCISCVNVENEEDQSHSRQPLFALAENCGIDFVNRLSPTTKFSTFDYQYFQNGGGVAVADFNNDGLKDLFFTSNQESDKLYLNKGNLKFEDISTTAKISGFENNTLNSWSTGVTICDVNRDGFMDIYVCKSGPLLSGAGTQNLLYINNRDLTFSEQAKKYGIHDQGHSTQAVFFDYDKDLDLDLFVMNHGSLFGNPEIPYVKRNDMAFLREHSSKLYKNTNGRFNDVTQEAGLLKFTYGLGLVASDFDGDDDIDLYVASDFSRPDCMYLNNGDGTFTDRIKSNTGHISFYAMGCDAADINNNGMLDISVVDMAPANNFRSKTLMPSMEPEDFKIFVDAFNYQYQYMFNSLHLNQGGGQFSEVAKLVGVHKTDWSWATLLADLDNDGYKDMFVSNGYMYNKMENDFSGDFKKMVAKYNGKIPEAVKAEWITKPPSYKLKNYAFKNIKGAKFEKRSDDWGFKEKTFSNGAAYADLDNDGDLDIVLNNIGDRASVYENDAANRGENFVQIDLRAGGRTNLDLILNAKVTIHQKEEIQYQELTLVRGFQSTVDDVLHFGLGDISVVDSIVVKWSDSRHQVVIKPPINERIVIDKTESQSAIVTKDKIRKTVFNRSNISGLNFSHRENEYDDFKNELLLPHKNSQHGPSISIGDINGDGKEDVYIGGAKDQAGALFLQNEKGEFNKSNDPLWQAEAGYEDVNSIFFDADMDGDNDLYVVSGGNEFYRNSSMLSDRLYLNNGDGKFVKSKDLPVINSSGSVAVAFDIDEDGDLDLFVGGRMIPGKYPYPSDSYFLLNENGNFKKSREQSFEEISGLGMVTDAIVTDFNGDKMNDLVIVGEWSSVHMLQNNNGVFKDVSPNNMRQNTGWWSAVNQGDFDNDGDLDYVVGNLGLNYKYNASLVEPFHVYANDFDKTGNLDIVLGYFNEGNLYPLRGRECSSEQMPFLKEKFPTYKKFASATLEEVYGNELDKSYHLQATNFSNSLLINEGDGRYRIVSLPMEAQTSCINGIVVRDFNDDGNLDILTAGNLFAAEVETPRNDAGIGLLLYGRGDNTFTPVPFKESGFFARGDVKDLKTLKVGSSHHILVANNNGAVESYIIE